MPVRLARSDDVALIAEIHVRSWQAAYAGLIPQDYLDALDPARRLDRWAAAVAGTQQAAAAGAGTAGQREAVLVATGEQDRAAGFASVGACRDADERGAGAGEIRAIYLEPAAWGTGLGRELMTAATARLAELGYRQATLWVLDGNARARRFYTAAGFEPDGAVKIDGERGFTLQEIRYRRALA